MICRITKELYSTFSSLFKLFGLEKCSIISFIDSTADERTIWMLRYGLSFEDIEILGEHIDTIGEGRITFKISIQNLPDSFKISIQRFL